MLHIIARCLRIFGLMPRLKFQYYSYLIENKFLNSNFLQALKYDTSPDLFRTRIALILNPFYDFDIFCVTSNKI